MSLVEDPLRDRLIAHLRNVGSDSISGVARALSEGRDKPIHRLTVAGYLSALSEEGVLREVARPPSKHYQLSNPNQHRDLYERVGQAVREVAMPVEARGATALAVLYRVLGRPVFRAELQRVRLPVPDDLPRAVMADEDRRRVRLALQKRRLHNVDVPRADPMFVPPAADLGPVDEVLKRALLIACDADHLAEDTPRGRQVALPMGDHE